MVLDGCLSYTVHLTKPTPTLLWCYSHELQCILTQDLLPDLWTCIRVSSHHPPFWLPPFVLRFSSILTTNPMNLHHSSAFWIVFKSPVWSGFLAPKQRNRTRTGPRKIPRPGNQQLDRKKPVLNGPYISCNWLQPVFWKTGPQLGYVWKPRSDI